ncbi:hypothetical protein IQ07DRAFT_196914 [Pyrenochaeta sp. DS3sAY3a]|nr:hypothetical protein IQ07DRAFT_196914 [Pyrenochaeta sp. DS3sAY3a]
MYTLESSGAGWVDGVWLSPRGRRALAPSGLHLHVWNSTYEMEATACRRHMEVMPASLPMHLTLHHTLSIPRPHSTQHTTAHRLDFISTTTCRPPAPLLHASIPGPHLDALTASDSPTAQCLILDSAKFELADSSSQAPSWLTLRDAGLHRARLRETETPNTRSPTLACLWMMLSFCPLPAF